MKIIMKNLYQEEGRNAYFKKEGNGEFSLTLFEKDATDLNEGQVATILKKRNDYLKIYGASDLEVTFSEDRVIEGKWFELWYADKIAMITTMHRNLASDLDNGYDPLGRSITNQRKLIQDYENNFDIELKNIRDMKGKQQVEHWCYYDLKRRGAID